jgi:hypothetical protein
VPSARPARRCRKTWRRTRALIDKSLGLVVTLIKLIKMSNVPLMRPARRTVLEIVEILER